MFRAVFFALLVGMGFPNVRSQLLEGAAYFAAGAALDSMAQGARFGWAVLPGSLGKECLLLSHSCRSMALHVSTQFFPKEKHPAAYQSWENNRQRLSQIAANSEETRELLRFLERRWLAKSSEFRAFMVDWVCPCYGVSVQVQPGTNSAYARDPASQISTVYQTRVETWKGQLPHPMSFPLLLTRAADVRAYLPPSVQVLPGQAVSIEQGKSQMLDVTALFPDWKLSQWETFRDALLDACRLNHVNPSQIVCIQRIEHNGLGGIRVLPLTGTVDEKQLLRWVSEFGLTATRTELDGVIKVEKKGKSSFKRPDFFPESEHTELLPRATIRILNGLLDCASWGEITACPTRAAVVDMSLTNIRKELALLQPKAPFFQTARHIEEIHAHLSSLLAVCQPFSAAHFGPLYESRLTQIPKHLKPYLSCALHASAMTSFAGILKAAEKTAGRPLHILYGENTYFECINVVERVSEARPVAEAGDADWREVDLIVAQFNPALKRPALSQTEFQRTCYRVEPVSEMVRRALSSRENRPLTIALDCTFDFIDSVRVAQVLEEFQSEIQQGRLNVVCYRSGLKFDLFGMDNYAGAPFAMIHVGPQWAFFDALLEDPVLQADCLSLQWFCLAYRYAADELNLYRKQVFDNTRKILRSVPFGLYASDAAYRLIPMEEGLEAAFLDFKVSGPFHAVRAGAIVGGYLLSQCFEQGHPTFTRRSVGFYHPNFSVLFGEEQSTIRLTLGIDPGQVDVYVRCFEDLYGIKYQ